MRSTVPPVRLVPISVVVPAHDEEAVVGRCLDALLAGARPGELDVVVVCNGCSDRTADVARARGPAVRVIETPVASKTHALNLGDEAALWFPRLYVDADVVLPLAAVRRIARRLLAGDAPAAAPVMVVDLSASSWAVRAFYEVWTRLPYTREGMIGVGVYALSESGRRRFGRFPDVVADDGFVRAQFDAGERVRVDEAPVRVVAPATLADLVRVKTRSRLGGYELTRRFPDLMRRERSGKDYGGAVRDVAFRPRLWPSALVYLWVNAAARFRARRQIRSGRTYVWERDASSRAPLPHDAPRRLRSPDPPPPNRLASAPPASGGVDDVRRAVLSAGDALRAHVARSPLDLFAIEAAIRSASKRARTRVDLFESKPDRLAVQAGRRTFVVDYDDAWGFCIDEVTEGEREGAALEHQYAFFEPTTERAVARMLRLISEE